VEEATRVVRDSRNPTISQPMQTLTVRHLISKGDMAMDSSVLYIANLGKLNP
jgi:hypothetical protein